VIAATTGFGDPGDRAQRGLQGSGPLDHVGVGHVGHLLDVRAGGEDPLPAVDDHGPDVVALGGLDRGRPDLLLHLHVERVHLRSVQPDRADPVGHLQSYELAHLVTCLSWCALEPAPPSGTAIRVVFGI